MDKLILSELTNGLNTVWMLLAAMLVFFMQPGFALVEAGFTRVKNTANILMKNFVDFMFGSLLYWFIGFGLMFGAGGFIGMPHFFDLSFYDGVGLPTEGFLVFQTVFCATAATIVSGAMAERTKRRLSGIPNCILCHSSYYRIRSHGRTYQILHVPGLHHLHQCADLSRFRSLD